MDLHNKNILITGASQGLGLGLAMALADKGANLILVARGEAKLNRVAEKLRLGRPSHQFIYGISADISKKEAIYRLVIRATALLKAPLDILINNASTLGTTPLRLLLDTGCEDLEQVLQTNLIGPHRLTKAIVGNMVLRKEGLIVNISSDAAIEAYPTWGSYSASKAANDHLTRIWAAELEPTRVRFLSVDPGEMNTQMHADAVPDADPQSLADPGQVALKLVHLIANAETEKNGSRVILSKWEVPNVASNRNAPARSA
ncbi:MAG: SDR family oxidoreductase [Bdellovibrionota bacterium]